MSNDEIAEIHPETAARIRLLFHPVDIIALNKTSRHVHLVGDWKRDLANAKSGYVVGSRTTFEVLEELVEEKALDRKEPLFVYLVGGTVKRVVYEAKAEKERLRVDGDSRPITTVKQHLVRGRK